MMNSIEKIKNKIRDNMKNFKSIEADINKFELHIKKNEYLPASKILKKVNLSIIKYFPDFEKELKHSEEEISNQVRQFKRSFDDNLISACKEHNFLPVEGNSRKGFKIKGYLNIKTRGANIILPLKHADLVVLMSYMVNILQI